MTKNGKCLWIVETLLQAGALSLRELNERWERSALYDGHRIQERTFSRYKEHIAEEYAIDIDYSPSTNTYDIVNREEIRDNALYRYLFAAYHIADLNTQTLRHRDRVMMEPVPTGAEHLATILDAIDRKRTVRFNYTSYYSSELQDWELVPAFLRVFEGRWYLIAEYMNRQRVKTFALERISRLQIGEMQAESSPELCPEEYYAGCYGIIREAEKRPRLIACGPTDSSAATCAPSRCMNRRRRSKPRRIIRYLPTFCGRRSTSTSGFCGCVRRSNFSARKRFAGRWLASLVVLRKSIMRNSPVCRNWAIASDKIFSRSNIASDFCMGRSLNGWTLWKDKDGNTLDSAYRKQLE